MSCILTVNASTVTSTQHLMYMIQKMGGLFLEAYRPVKRT